MISIDFLKKVEILQGLGDAQLGAVLDCCHEKKYSIGDKLFSEGDTAGHLWIVLEGQVDIRFDLPGRPTSEENNISSLTETMVFGWSCIVPPNIYKLTAYCVTQSCKVVRIDKAALFDLFEKDSEIGYKVMLNGMGVVGKRLDKILSIASDIPAAKVEVTVHMATCGIAAGAREVMKALTEEVSKSGRKDIKILTSGCIGKCPTEPNVTVKIGWENPVVYQEMNADKMRRVFGGHVLKGEIQSAFVLANS